MDIQKIKNMPKEQREEKVITLRKELMTLRFQKSSGQLKNPSKIRFLAKDVARLLTIQRQEGK